MISMNKKPLIIVFIVILIISGGLLYLINNSDDSVDDSSVVPKSESEDKPEQIEPNTTNSTLPNSYIDYTDTVIADTSGTKLLFFHAPWCPQCRDLETDIENNDVPSGVTIIKVDYDSNQSLRQKYGVTIQTTVVRVDDEGNLVDKFVAYDDPTLNSIIENLL